MEPSRSHPPSSGHPGPLRARKGEGNGEKRERKQERDRTVINHTLACLLSIQCPVMTVCLGPRGASKHITVNKHPQPSHAAVLPHTHKNTHRRTKKKVFIFSSLLRGSDVEDAMTASHYKRGAETGSVR